MLQAQGLLKVSEHVILKERSSLALPARASVRLKDLLWRGKDTCTGAKCGVLRSSQHDISWGYKLGIADFAQALLQAE